MSAAVVDEGEPAAVGRLVHVVRGDEQRHALLGQVVEQVPELPAGDRVDAARRLVEEEQLRLVDGRAPSARRCFQPTERFAVSSFSRPTRSAIRST